MTNSPICQLLSDIDKFLESGEFARALDSLRPVDISDFDQVSKGHYYLQRAQCSFASANYEETDIDLAVDALKSTSENDLFGRAKFLKAQFKIARGSLSEAREILTESYAAYLRSGNLAGCATVLNRLAFVSFHTGDIPAAIDSLHKCINIYESLGARSKGLVVRNNLAILQYVSGNICAALFVLNIIKREYSTLSNEYKFLYKLSHGLALGLRGDYRNAHKTMEMADIQASLGLRQLAQHSEYRGYLFNLQGDFASAVSQLTTGLELALKIAPESSLISQTKRLLADAYLGLKKYDLAQKFAKEALAVAEKINERAEIAACWRVFAQVALHNGDKDKAREWFKKAIELFSMISSRYELAVTRYLAAVSGLYGEGERAALLYLAKEYFEAEEIAPYMEKVNRELAGIAGQGRRIRSSHSGNNGNEFIGASPVIVKIRKLAENIADSSMSVLLTGPTGSGKDQLARYIHACSGRTGPFVSVNCAAVPEGMVESELFGFKRGAFTGADIDKPGLLEKADKGTFYLNEIADTTSQFQAKLLEVIESRAIRQLGSTELQPLDFRLIAATNQNLETLLKEGRFRPDLYHRLNEVAITLPPLSERTPDIPLLVRYFLEQCQMVFDENGCLEQLGELCRHLAERDWPGNLRELRAEIQRLHHLAGGDLGGMLALVKEEVSSERELLLRTLERTGWNQSATARELGVTEAGVRYKIRRFGLERKGNSKSSS
jgi:DNA-binding NtrC family response regulator